MILGKNPWRWFERTVRTKGLLRPFKIAWHTFLDFFWDLRHGTDTLSRIEREHLETQSENKNRATCYGATRARPLLLLLHRLGLAKERAFVDLGAGKGRVLILAAQYGFKKIVGIEFSEPLCQTARRNVEKSRRKNPWAGQVDIVHSDAVRYAFQPDESVFFLYDPFNPEVLEQVLRNLRHSLLVHPREICLIYNSPRHHEVLAASGIFSRRSDHEIGGNEFAVYAAEAA